MRYNNTRRYIKLFGVLSLIAVVYWWSLTATEFSLVKILDGVPFMADFLFRMYPPDLTVTPTAFAAVMETVQIAVLGTTLGVSLALPLGFMAAKNISPPVSQIISRSILNLIRTIPTILWAIFFVSAVGLGPFPGVLAIALYSAGMLGKFYFEAIEAIDPEPVEAIAATGARKLQIMRYAIIPQFLPHFLSYTFYQFEYNVRASAVLGIVGAGGVGFYILMYIRSFQYDKVAIVILVLLATVITIDWLSSKIRSKII